MITHSFSVDFIPFKGENTLIIIMLQVYLAENQQKQEANFLTSCYLLAEREGFEPPVPLSTAVFKTAVIDHSTISP